jgi:O-antigen ligase
MSLPVRRKGIALAGASFLLLALAHIPNSIFRHSFDKNASTQFFLLAAIGSLFALLIFIGRERLSFHRAPVIGVAALVAAQIISLSTSHNPWGSLFGDSGRFVGVASVIALLAVAIFHARFTIIEFISLLRFYIVALEAVVLVGIAQHFKLIELPGDAGLTSTLGNTDFFAAFVGTSFPLLALLALHLSNRGRIALSLIAALNIYALYLAGPLQGYLDIAFTVLGLAILLLRRYLPRREVSLNVRTFLGTFAVIIWAEFIFLMPFLGKSIPVLGSDIQVQIRGNFWLAGMKQFFANPVTGVGPDNYGNYYEQYRTLEDLSKYSTIVSNDAHSASVQTLATLGIIGVLAYLSLIALLIRALLILWDRRTIDRRALYVIGLYIFVYLTNSFISPITLTHKYLFWAVAGAVIGFAYRKEASEESQPKILPITAALTSLTLIAIAITFAGAQWNYLTNIEKYVLDKKSTLSYQTSLALPCFMYFDAEIKMVAESGDERAEKFAQEAVAKNARCISAELFLAKMDFSKDRISELKPHIYRLMEIAPARNETLSMGMYYANRTRDTEVATKLQRVMQALGLVYLPGKLG